MPLSPPTRRWKVAVVGGALGFGLIAAPWLLAGGRQAPPPAGETLSTADVDAMVQRELWPVIVSAPKAPPRIATGEVDSLGHPVSVSCVSCHTSLSANASRRSATEPPMQFHKGLKFDHGTLACISCHNKDDYNTLRLADSTAISYTNVMNLCAQCHAPQARDWEHGAHGGMTGHWDLTRGSRIRKNCIDCHDPHSPGFPAMVPTFKPRDRGLHPPHHPAADDHGTPPKGGRP
jgi:nitrate/TMAO reductase-like tetraheme cytochrome c subunit